ncbi:MAG: serine/threonine-protein kinase [Egibacteraceae bacterium]
MGQTVSVRTADRQGIADYQFVRFLGEGNHGAFYLAKPPARIRVEAAHVAVKVLTGSVYDDALRRLTRELQVFAAVRSPYLVTLLDAGQEGATCFYATEYYPDGSLGGPGRPLTRAEVCRAVACAARGAHALHEAGIVHRDVKPENILLTPDGARLSDVGLAQILSPGQTVTGMGPIESVEYMDPAIIRGDRASRATDIWALGATLHRVLTGKSLYGQLPHAGDPILLLRHILKNPPQLDEPNLSADEAKLIAACTAPDPARRLRTAADVAERLESIADR